MLRARCGRIVAGLGAGLVLLVGGTLPAEAHNSLRSTSPVADAVLGPTPAAIVLTFDEPAIAMGTRVVVTGPSGPVQSGEPRLVDKTVTQPLQPGAPAGRYVVEWRVTSADGHPITGTFVFTSGSAGTGESVPAPTAPAVPAEPGLASPGLAVAALAALLLALAVVVYAFRRAWSVNVPRYDRSASPADRTEAPDQTRTESRPPADE